MRYKQFDSVTLLTEQCGVCLGSLGTVLDVYAETGSYLVEFDEVDDIVEVPEQDLTPAPPSSH